MQQILRLDLSPFIALRPSVPLLHFMIMSAHNWLFWAATRAEPSSREHVSAAWCPSTEDGKPAAEKLTDLSWR